jgi:hypothetical protein
MFFILPASGFLSSLVLNRQARETISPSLDLQRSGQAGKKIQNKKKMTPEESLQRSSPEECKKQSTLL